MKKGNVIFLNGVSSAGKSTLAKALQKRLEEPYFSLSCDMFQGDMIPDKFRTKDDAGLELFLRAMSGFHHTIKLFSDMGFHTIIDQVFEKPHNTLEECLRLLNEYPVLFVHVTCPIEELNRREKERSNRPIGLAGYLLSVLEPQNIYDVIVDTYNETQDKCVDKIIRALENPDCFSAFKTLWSQRNARHYARNRE